MFPFRQNHDCSSQIFSSPHLENTIQEDVIWSQSPLRVEGSKQMENGQTSSPSHGDIIYEQKKNMRKEIERQRRKQMSTLYSSLRSLLPLSSLKGKRSISDHMNEAVIYINHLKNNIKQLSVKRDKLKKSSNSSNIEHKSSDNSANNSLLNCVTVRPHLEGVEIMISRSLGEERFPFSRVLDAVLEEGFHVLSCVSTRRDERFYNTIQCQADSVTCINIHGLQQKLNDVILSSRYVSD